MGINMKIDGRFWLTKDDKNFLGRGRIELLHKIIQTGSINAAAKEMKMSYKAAWERLNSMNALAGKPILQRQTGGKGGGGTTLTEYAYELIQTYERLDELHRQFINRFSEAGENPQLLSKILQRTFLTTSARNQIPAIISSIQTDELSSIIGLKLFNKTQIYALITSKSVQNMNLAVDAEVYAVIKSNDIKINRQKPKESLHVNVIEGEIINIESTQKQLEITLKVDEKTQFTTLMKQDPEIVFSVGETAYATVSYDNILIGF
jgi:molybdate transport system regulatory protein